MIQKTSLFLCSFFALNLLHGQYNEESSLVDANQDGISDSLYTYYDGGSGFGGQSAEIIDGATGKKYMMDLWSCYCDSWLIRALPADYNSKANKAFYDLLISELFGEVVSEPDPSLKWIFEAHLNMTEPDSNSIYERILSVPLNWQPKPDSFNYSYSLKLNKVDLNRFYRTYSEKPLWFDKSPAGLVRKYNGHLQTKQIIEHNDHQLLLANHSIMMEREDGKAAWLFVTDPYITGGPEKLRWPSIGELHFMDELVIFELSLAPGSAKYVYVIDPNSGEAGRIRTMIEGSYDGHETGISIRNNVLTISNGDGKHSLSKTELLYGLKVK